MSKSDESRGSFLERRANFRWVLPAVQAVLPLLRESTRGASIINFTSIEGHRTAPRFAVYAAMKAALTSL